MANFVHLDQCTSGFPDAVSPDGSFTGQGDSTKVTTWLFPDLRFGCSGTIVRMIVAVVNRGGRGVPKIQIWRENENQYGVYCKAYPDIPIIDNSSVCVRHRLSGGRFRCTLSDHYQLSVQSGDILGLELPPRNDDDFDIYFTPGGPTSYIFEGKLDSTVNISEATYNKSNYLPQISLVVTLGMTQLKLHIYK